MRAVPAGPAAGPRSKSASARARCTRGRRLIRSSPPSASRRDAFRPERITAWTPVISAARASGDAESAATASTRPGSCGARSQQPAGGSASGVMRTRRIRPLNGDTRFWRMPMDVRPGPSGRNATSSGGSRGRVDVVRHRLAVEHERRGMPAAGRCRRAIEQRQRRAAVTQVGIERPRPTRAAVRPARDFRCRSPRCAGNAALPRRRAPARTRPRS